ncbi:DUF3617 domain-containing protein [Phenylobacterium sp.]|jgi:hypothetical protein|uniref:DUF3617 domain-containing protein n=1 Tax=Phenylobacterium sp. TaxID=1871053 RepID=UPI002F40B221
MTRSQPLLVVAPLLAVPFAVALVAAWPAAAQNSISPGYWETTNKVTSPFPTRKTERRCIKPQDVAKFMQGSINHIYTCTYPTREIESGKIRLEGTCSTRDGPAIPISGQGTFTSDALHIEARIVPQIGGLSVPVRASTDAKRLADTCPVEDQGEAQG